jgi:hypothetical protein
LKINTALVMSEFDNAGGVEEISLRKQLKETRRNRAPHSTWRNESIEFL